jgi:hypothetical protein
VGERMNSFPHLFVRQSLDYFGTSEPTQLRGAGTRAASSGDAYSPHKATI